MRTLLVSTLLLLTVSVSWANEKLYNKLNKLYLSDRDKCMEASKKVMKKKSTESIPYYFTSVIYYDKSKESQTLKGTYLQLNRSVISAAKFEKYSGDEDRALVRWDEHVSSLRNRAERLIKTLDKNEMGDLSLSLTESLAKVASLSQFYKEEEVDDLLTKSVIKDVESTAVPTDFTRIEGQFYGMPSGNENVLSRNVEEEKKLLDLINKERAKKRIPALAWNEDLAKACRYHAYDQGTQGYFSHASNDKINDKLVIVGSTFDRIKRFYRGNAGGECIAAGNQQAEKTFQQWLNSDGHAKILLEHDSRVVGIGFVQVEGSPHEYYWVLATGN